MQQPLVADHPSEADTENGLGIPNKSSLNWQLLIKQQNVEQKAPSELAIEDRRQQEFFGGSVRNSLEN